MFTANQGGRIFMDKTASLQAVLKDYPDIPTSLDIGIFLFF